jgi:hypothetical protein
MALIDQAALAADPTFQSKIRVASVQYAATVITAAKTANTRADEKKYALAVTVLADGGVSTTVRFAYGIASASNFPFTPGSPPTASDAAVKSAIATAWPTVAGVTTFDIS